MVDVILFQIFRSYLNQASSVLGHQVKIINEPKHEAYYNYLGWKIIYKNVPRVLGWSLNAMLQAVQIFISIVHENLK